VRWRAGVACGLVALAAAAPAAAAPGWSSAPVSEAGALGPTGLEFAADGSASLTWEGYVPGHRPSAKLTGLALRSPAGAWTRGPDVPGVTWGLARLRVVGSRTVMVGMRAYAIGRFNRARWEVVTATGRLDGSFDRVRALVRDVRWTGSAAGGHGEVLAGWVARRDDALRVARVLPSRRPARRVSPPGVARPLLVMGPRGHVLAAWTRGRRIAARLRTPGGRWGPIHGIATTGLVPGELHGAVSGDGRAIVAWGAYEPREDRPGRRDFAAATTRSGTRWATRRLESFEGSGSVPATARPAFDASGRGLVAWGGADAVKLARPDGSALRRVPVAAPVSVDDIAVSRTGEVALVFTPAVPSQGAGPGPFVAGALPGAGLGAPVDVGSPGTTPLPGAKLAFDPVSARPTVAWTALGGGVARLWTTSRDAA
jgi:hypothetical protein